MSLWRAPIIAALCLLLGACSAVRLGYGQAPTLTYWWLDRYVDFNDQQTPRVRDAIDAWFAWNRRTQLTDYADLLARAASEVPADTSAARTCEWFAELQRRVDRGVEHGLPAAAELALTLTPAQIQHIESRYASNNDEFRKDYLQPDRAVRHNEAVERAVERAETIYGSLGAAERNRIARVVAESPFDPELWLSERVRRQQELLQALRRITGTPTSREQAQAALQAYVDHVRDSPRENYRRYSERLIRYNCEAGAALHNVTTPAQRQVALQKIRGWEADLRALAAAPP